MHERVQVSTRILALVAVARVGVGAAMSLARNKGPVRCRFCH
jgi:hypothetical protein